MMGERGEGSTCESHDGGKGRGQHVSHMMDYRSVI